MSTVAPDKLEDRAVRGDAGSSSPILKLAWVFLAVQAAVLLGLCLTSDAFALYPVDLDNYFATLKQMQATDLRGILKNERTPLYPYFLKAVTLISPTLDALPFVQMALRVVGVAVFFAGLRRIGMNPWFAALVSSPLLYTNIIFSHDASLRVTHALTDAQGESLLILTVGFLLLLAARPGKLWPWVGFTVSLVFLYMMRPASQFMIFLLPALGIVLVALAASRAEWLRLRWRVGAGLFACGLLPYLAWCTFRLVMVGHFGLISFMGYNMCAIAGNFFTDDLVPQLPQHLQPYFKRVIERRDKIVAGELKAAFGEWRPSFDEKGNLLPGILEDDSLYTLLAHDLFCGAAMDMLVAEGAEIDQVRIDNMMMEAARAILKLRWDYLLRWFVASLRELPAKLIFSNRVLLYLCHALLVAFLLWHLAYVFRRVRGGPEGTEKVARSPLPFLWELNVLGVIGVAVVLSQGLLLAAVATTSWGSRYCDSPGIFLPPLLLGAIAALLWRSGQLLGFLPAPSPPRAPADGPPAV